MLYLSYVINNVVRVSSGASPACTGHRISSRNAGRKDNDYVLRTVGFPAEKCRYTHT